MLESFTCSACKLRSAVPLVVIEIELAFLTPFGRDNEPALLTAREPAGAGADAEGVRILIEIGLSALMELV